MASCRDVEIPYYLFVSIAAPEPVKDRKFTVDEYYRMVEVGLIARDERVELINGRVLQMSPIGPTHAFLVQKLNEILGGQLTREYTMIVQSSVRLDQRNEPEPDLAVLTGPAERYRDRLPEAGDVRLLIEVSESSLSFDQNEKLELYAENGIPEVWIVNAVNKRVERYCEPIDRRYKKIEHFSDDQTICAGDLEELRLAVADLLL